MQSFQRHLQIVHDLHPNFIWHFGIFVQSAHCVEFFQFFDHFRLLGQIIARKDFIDEFFKIIDNRVKVFCGNVSFHGQLLTVLSILERGSKINLSLDEIFAATYQKTIKKDYKVSISD